MNAKLMTPVMAVALGCGAFAQNSGLAPTAQGQVAGTTQAAPATGGRPSSSAGGYAVGNGYGRSGGGVSSGRGSTSFGTRMNSIVARTSGSPSAATVVTFEPMKPKTLEEMQEDLKVFGLIIYRGLERAFGDRNTEYRLGVPMLLQGEHRAVQASYLDGFGVVVKVVVPFPVAQIEGEVKTKKETGATASEWEKARRALLGETDSDADPSLGNAPAPYDEKLIATLKKQMFESIKNGSNLRHVKSDEWISLVIVGAGGGPGRNDYRAAMETYGGAVEAIDAAGSRVNGSVLAMRVKKSALDGSVEQIEQAAQTNGYLDLVDNPAPTMNRYPTAGR